MTMMYVNGPYTFNSTLSYAPLNLLVQRVLEEKPHVLVMNGPFIDCNHEDIAEGEVLFEKHSGEISCLEFGDLMVTIFQFLEEKLSESRVKIIIVPSLKDIVNLYPLPQPSFHAGILR